MLKLLINLVKKKKKKTDYDTEILDIKSKYFTTADYNRFTNEKRGLKIKHKQLVNKSDLAGFMDNSILNKKLATLETKVELKTEKDKIAKLEVFDSSYIKGKSHFEDDGTQNYLVFEPMSRYLKKC